MNIAIGKELDLSIHMKIVIALADTIFDAVAAENLEGLDRIRMALMLLIMYLEELNKEFEKHNVNID
jgi:hypothetical protein